MRRFLLIIYFLLLSFVVFANENYMAEAEGSGPGEKEAAGTAVENALAKIIKDPGLREIYLADWYTAIDVLEKEVLEKKRHKVTVRVRIKINPVTINQAEQKFTAAIIRKLNETEQLLSEIEILKTQAQNEESAGRQDKAYTLYKQADALIQEAEKLLSVMEGPSSVQSDEGYTRTALLERLRSLKEALDSGLKRMAEYHRKLQEEDKLEEYRKSYDRVKEDQIHVAVFLRDLQFKAPFTEQSLRPNLPALLVEIENHLDKTSTVQKEYKHLLDLLKEEQKFFAQMLKSSLTESRAQEKLLKNYRKMLKAEIRMPFPERQERARRRKEKAKQFRKAVFTHDARDYFSLRYFFPFEFGFGKIFGLSQALDIELKAEKVIDFIWLKGGNKIKREVYDNKSSSLMIDQELAVAFGKEKLFFGAGFSWDWWRGIFGDGRSSSGFRQFLIKAYLVGRSSESEKAAWHLNLSYNLPVAASPPVLLYALNLGVDFLGRIKNLLVFECGGSTRAKQSLHGERADMENSMNYQLEGYFGMGFRAPQPFLWTVRLEGLGQAPIIDGNPGDLSWYGRIRFSLEYVF